MDVDLGEMVTDSRLIGMQISARGSRALSREGLTAIQARVLLYILVRSKRGTSLTEIHRETGYSMAATGHTSVRDVMEKPPGPRLPAPREPIHQAR